MSIFERASNDDLTHLTSAQMGTDDVVVLDMDTERSQGTRGRTTWMIAHIECCRTSRNFT
jgi:hypothetical protein